MIDEKKFRKALEFICELSVDAGKNKNRCRENEWGDLYARYDAAQKAYDAALIVFGELIDD